MKKLEIFHLLSCLGIADANYYYRWMAQRGWYIEKTNMSVDYFTKREIEGDKYLFAFPVGNMELTKEEIDEYELKLLAANRNYAVYEGKPEQENIFFDSEHIGGSSLMKLALLFAYPICIYYLGSNFFSYGAEAFPGWMKTLYLLSAVVAELCIAWGYIWECFEMRYIRKHNKLVEFNKFRFAFHVGLTHLANLAQIAVICIIFYTMFL